MKSINLVLDVHSTVSLNLSSGRDRGKQVETARGWVGGIDSLLNH